MTAKAIKKYLNFAIDISKQSTVQQARLGAVLVSHNKVINASPNLEKTHPMQAHLNKLRGFDPMGSGERNILHAEIATLLKRRDLDIEWNKSMLFIARLKKNGDLGLARPCNACMGLIKQYGIKNIYYTTDNGWCYERIEQHEKQSRI